MKKNEKWEVKPVFPVVKSPEISKNKENSRTNIQSSLDQSKT